MADEPKRAESEQNNVAAEPAAANENNPVAVLEAQVAELRDKFLRAVAEAENVRKRAEREVADERAYGIAGFARDILVAPTISPAPSTPWAPRRGSPPKGR